MNAGGLGSDTEFEVLKTSVCMQCWTGFFFCARQTGTLQPRLEQLEGIRCPSRFSVSKRRAGRWGSSEAQSTASFLGGSSPGCRQHGLLGPASRSACRDAQPQPADSGPNPRTDGRSSQSEEGACVAGGSGSEVSVETAEPAEGGAGGGTCERRLGQGMVALGAL